MPEIHHWSAGRLDKLPRRNGFRQRGMDMTRLEAFTDAAFAFAVTLLVIGGGDSVPSNYEEMVTAMKQVPAFAASFANIMWFWYAHHIWSRRFGLDDTKSAVLSLVLIFVVLVYVYPLKAVYSGAIDWFSRGYFDSYFPIRSVADLRDLFSIFGSGYAALSLLIVLLNRHALGMSRSLMLDEIEKFDTRTEMQFWLISTVVASISLVLAILLPDELITLAGLFYCVFGIAYPWHGVRRDRQRDALRQQRPH
ncbi:MAG: DUF1211 domain-containing protein [Gammaproteobacteria bacterium]|nr:DUF1211 domain-containing protein [Gammaproteobacteria bacterium]